MSDAEQLRGLGQQLASALVASYGALVPHGTLVFLPGGVSVPADLVQSGVINPTQMQTWLSINFDAPFVVSGGDGAVLEKDASHGSASQIYTTAVTAAQPLGAPIDANWVRVNGEIAEAQRTLGVAESPKPVMCSPDDWALPTANAGYWTKFDSSTTSASSTQTETVVPAVRPEFWMVRSLTVRSPSPPPATVLASKMAFAAERRVGHPGALDGSRFSLRASPLAASIMNPAPQAVATNAGVLDESSHLLAWRSAVDHGRFPARVESRALFHDAPAVEQVTTSTSSTITIHLEHQCVNLGYMRAGVPWWDGVFLADDGWFIPGMQRGGLLPVPDGTPDAAYGLPASLIIVQRLSISGQWSAEAAAALSSPGGTLGPLSLFGAVASTNADGVTICYAHEGMQVVALVCTPIPVLPPADSPGPPA